MGCNDRRHVFDSAHTSTLMNSKARCVSWKPAAGRAEQIGCSFARDNVVFRIAPIFEDTGCSLHGVLMSAVQLSPFMHGHFVNCPRSHPSQRVLHGAHRPLGVEGEEECQDAKGEKEVFHNGIRQSIPTNP